jgi:hypothetical protein
VSETGQFRDPNMFGEDQHVEQVACSTVRSLAVVTGVSVELLGQVLRHVDSGTAGAGMPAKSRRPRSCTISMGRGVPG